MGRAHKRIIMYTDGARDPDKTVAAVTRVHVRFFLMCSCCKLRLQFYTFFPEIFSSAVKDYHR